MLKNLTDENFHNEVREEQDPVIILFTGSWCQPCKRLKPVVEDMAKQMESDIKFMIADIETAGKVTEELNIRSVPSLVLFSEGMVREVYSGTMQKDELHQWIQENI